MPTTLEANITQRYELRQKLHDLLRGVDAGERSANTEAKAVFKQLQQTDRKVASATGRGGMTAEEVTAAYAADPSGVGRSKMLGKGAQWSKTFTASMYDSGKIKGFFELGGPDEPPRQKQKADDGSGAGGSSDAGAGGSNDDMNVDLEGILAGIESQTGGGGGTFADTFDPGFSDPAAMRAKYPAKSLESQIALLQPDGQLAAAPDPAALRAQYPVQANPL